MSACFASDRHPAVEGKHHHANTWSPLPAAPAQVDRRAERRPTDIQGELLCRHQGRSRTCSDQTGAQFRLEIGGHPQAH